MKIALAQMCTSQDKEQNIQTAVNYIALAKQSGADLIVMPELCMAYIPPRSSLQQYNQIAEPLSGNFVNCMQQAARQHNIYVICGVYEAAQGQDARVYNTTVMLDRQGRLIYRYRKTHLYDAFKYRESDFIIAGSHLPAVVDTEFGKLGVLVCYELRFPEVSRQLVLQGADILLTPAAWVVGAMKEEHLATLAKARAIENTSYVCIANQTGNVYTGGSAVYDPMGVSVAAIGESEGLVFAELNTQRIANVRQKLPCLAHRRPQLYGTDA